MMQQGMPQGNMGMQPPMGAEGSGQMAMGGQSPMPMAAPPPPPTPQMAEGGAVIKKSGGFKEFFEDINLLDVTISAFIVAGVLYAVKYYRYMLMIEKTGYADLSTRLNKIESAWAAKQAEMNAAGKMKQRGRRPVMRLG
jgi:hypothetical protein